jgi:hypothetical protein
LRYEWTPLNLAMSLLATAALMKSPGDWPQRIAEAIKAGSTP